jgi:hypothetical protein
MYQINFLELQYWKSPWSSYKSADIKADGSKVSAYRINMKTYSRFYLREFFHYFLLIIFFSEL